jgi:hypothetical protein
MKAVLPAAGPGTRFLPLRKEPPRGRHGASRERDLPGWEKESGTYEAIYQKWTYMANFKYPPHHPSMTCAPC